MSTTEDDHKNYTTISWDNASEGTSLDGRWYPVSEVTIYQGEGAKDFQYLGARMHISVADFLNKDHERSRKKTSFEKIITALATQSDPYEVVPGINSTEEIVLPKSELRFCVATYPTVQHRLEKEDLIQKTFQALGERAIEITIEYRQQGYTPIEIERETGIDHRRVPELEKKFVKKLQEIEHFDD